MKLYLIYLTAPFRWAYSKVVAAKNRVFMKADPPVLPPPPPPAKSRPLDLRYEPLAVDEDINIPIRTRHQIDVLDQSPEEAMEYLKKVRKEYKKLSKTKAKKVLKAKKPKRSKKK